MFSDEKMFDLNGIYNAQNQRIWTVSRTEADGRGGVKMRRSFPQKFIVWLGVCSQGVRPLLVFDQGVVDHARYIDDVLPVALEHGNRTFGEHVILRQDCAKPQIHHLTQTWCLYNFPSLIDKDH